MRIFIVGPAASGKTTIGKKLAKFLKVDFFDTDEKIEEKSGANIAWIFDVEGEEGFRKREKQILSGTKNFESCVISTGGGIVLDKENRNFISSSGIVVYLRVSLKTQIQRTLFDKSRPLLKGNDKKEVLEKQFLERKNYYEEIADITIEEEKESRSKILENIILSLRKREECDK